MKINLRYVWIAAVAALPFFGSCSGGQSATGKEQSNTAQDNHPAFKDSAFSMAYTQYLLLKDALVASDAAEATRTATALSAALKSVPNAAAADAEATRISIAENIEAQRTAFTTLSNELISLAKAQELSAGKVFVAYCPMANNNTGGYWLSNEEAIRNPYFGDKMLKCGEVKETLEGK